MFKWNKKGKIFTPNGRSEWMFSNAQNPCSYDFGDYLRVYFVTREDYDANGMTRAHGGWVDLDKNDLTKVLRVSEKPTIELGGIGEFDEFGTMPCSIIKVDNEYYFYYAGWTRAYSTPYNWAVGLAKSTDAETFKKIGKGGPIIGSTMDEPYLQACPSVYRFGENEWHMFYISGQRWLRGERKMESQYLLVHATSSDGINWNRNPKPIIEPKVEYECQTSANVININERFHMFFCYRYGLDFRNTEGRGYAMGYAYSDDLYNWIRDDSQVGIELSKDGWDSKMLSYPHITKIDDKYVMFYCGNDFGKEGFGYAELEMIE